MQNNQFYFGENGFKQNSKIIKNLISELPKPVVFTNGVFDILHIGHIRYLQESKKLGSSLVVGINSNQSTKMLKKGKNRPIIDEKDRSEIVASIKAVDLCIIFDQQTPEDLIKLIRPEIYTKGADYNKDTITYNQTLTDINIKTVFIPLIDNKSSSKIIDRIINY